MTTGGMAHWQAYRIGKFTAIYMSTEAAKAVLTILDHAEAGRVGENAARAKRDPSSAAGAASLGMTTLGGVVRMKMATS